MQAFNNRTSLVYYSSISDLEREIPDSLLETFPVIIREEIRRYRKNDDQVRMYTGKYLLSFLIEILGFPKNTIEKYNIDNMGRPYIDGFPDFNITHSGNVVAIGFLDGHRVGIDVEMVRPIDAPAFTKQFSQKEIAEITGAEDILDTFFSYWTQKESVMKADGRGMRIPLHDIHLYGDHAIIQGNSSPWWLYPFEVGPEYKAHLCSPQPGLSPVVMRVNDVPGVL